MVRLFSLWKGTTKQGKSCLKGKLDNNYITVLPNEKKTNEKQPDFNVFISAPAPKENMPVKNYAPKANTDEEFNF